MRPVLIGYEPTAQGEDAVRLGGSLARTLGAPVVVGNVVPLPAHLIPSGEIEEALASDPESVFSVPRELLGDLEPRTRIVVEPSPAHALQDLAAAEDAALLVVGSCHRGTVGRVMLGSVATSLLHGSPCAVAVAPRGFDDARPVRRIGVAFDGSAESFAALDAAVTLARAAGDASLELLTVREPPTYGLATTFAILTAADWQAAERSEKQRVLDLGLGRVPGEIEARGHLLEGRVGSALAEAAADVDLLFCGSRAYGPIRRTLLGSAAARMMNEAPVPVIVVPRGTSEPLREAP